MMSDSWKVRIPVSFPLAASRWTWRVTRWSHNRIISGFKTENYTMVIVRVANDDRQRSYLREEFIFVRNVTTVLVSVKDLLSFYINRIKLISTAVTPNRHNSCSVMEAKIFSCLFRYISHYFLLGLCLTFNFVVCQPLSCEDYTPLMFLRHFFFLLYELCFL